MSKQQMHHEARQALAQLNLCKNNLTELISELNREYPDWFRVINLASIVAQHNTGKTHALMAFADLLESHAEKLATEGSPSAKLQSEPGESNVVKLRDV